MSLRVKFILASLAGIAVLLGVALWVSGRWAQDELEAAATQRGEILADGLARATAEQAIVGNYTQTRGVLQQVASSPGVLYAVVLDEAGRVMASSGDRAGRSHFPARTRLDDGRGTPPLRLRRKASFQGRIALEVRAPQEMYGRVWGAVQVGMSLDEVRAAIRALHHQLLLFGLAAFGVGALVAVFLAQRIVAPVRAIVRGAERFASGALSTRVRLARRDEIGRLARSFDEMAAAIERHVEEIRRQTHEIQLIYEVLEQLASTIDKELLVRRLLNASTKALRATHCHVSALDPRRDVVEVFEFAGGNYRFELLHPAAAGVKSFAELPDLTGFLSHRAGLVEGPETALATILGGGRELGVLALARSAGPPFDDGDRRLTAGIARHLAVALENTRLYEMAIRDGLTELYVKRYFVERLAEEADRSRRYERPLAVLMLDIDHFKRVNDTRGHLTGDRVLHEVARVVRGSVRTSDIVCRFGGEEIALLLPEQRRETGATVAEKIRRAIAEHEFPAADGGPPLALTVSIGVAALPADGTDATTLLAHADEALYAAKRSGRNRVAVAGSLPPPTPEPDTPSSSGSPP